MYSSHISTANDYHRYAVHALLEAAHNRRFKWVPEAKAALKRAKHWRIIAEQKGFSISG